MLDLEKVNLPIKHTTECLPEISRNEIYTLDDMQYTEQYLDPEGTLATGFISMYNGVRVGVIGSDGGVSISIPPSYICNHKTMAMQIEDLKRLDAFLCAINEQYNNG
jgi:hypothetical protein